MYMQQTEIWPVDASEKLSALKQRVLKKEAVAVTYRMVRSLQVLVVVFSPLSPSCITQLLGKCIHLCLDKQTLSSLDCHQKYLEVKYFYPKDKVCKNQACLLSKKRK